MSGLIQRSFRQSCSRFLFAAVLNFILLSLSSAQAQNNANQQVNNLRLWHSPDSTRVVFDVSGNVEHSIFTLQNPPRLVVDIADTDLSMQTDPLLEPDNLFISNIRTGEPIDDVLRFVFELKRQVSTNSFVLTPNELYGHRLVIDLNDPLLKSSTEHAITVGSEQSITDDLSNTPISTSVPEPSGNGVATNQPPILTPVVTSHTSQRSILIAIDAGHGGEDPGALGYRGSKEKVITLSIAKRLKEIFDQDPRYDSFLVRTGDYYIKLNQRRQIAHDKNADMFISIHADAFNRSSASGFSVFALSQRGATSAMASALAAKENASDLIGGVSLADKDEVLAKVLVDLSMTNTINESVNLGGRVIKELGKLGKLHSKRVEQAGFAVLKSPDMPSILIETGFITNPDEERKLGTSSYQDQVARGVYRAVNEYFEQTPYYNVATYQSPAIADTVASSSMPSSTRSSDSFNATHTVVRGDSLSKIAERYGTTLTRLKRENNLRSNVAMLGARLKVPSVNTDITSTSSIPAEHVVKRGESLSEISIRYNVTIRSIKAVNNLNRDTVYVGQKIKIPGGVVVSSGPQKHVVRSGDTLSEIAERYGSTMNKIMQANNMRSRTVMLGQTLSIP